MRPLLLLNHALLEDLAHRSEEGDDACREAQRPLVELADTLQRTRRLRREYDVLFVDQALGTFEVAKGKFFVHWANEHRREAAWGNVLDLLLQLLSGPWIQSLKVDANPRPVDTDPSCLHVPRWLLEILLIAAHHGLSCDRASFILSYGTRPYLEHNVYRVERDGRRIELANLRNDQAAADAEAALGLRDVRTTLDVLDEAARYTSRVRVLESARRSARQWELDCDPGLLFEAIRGLDAYARALDEKLPREIAAERYKEACGVDMSQEKAQTLKRPSLRKQREFQVPDLTEKQLFDMHAKPGNTRIHVFAREEAIDQADVGKGKCTVIYVGHCGKHLDLR